MSNEEFDNLKEELMWEGSSVVMLSMRPFNILKRIEQRFMHSIDFVVNIWTSKLYVLFMQSLL